MIYSRGNRLDYDLWEAMGNPGWSYKDVLPYFLKSEGASIAVNDSGYHNKDGPLGVSDLPYRTKSATVFLEAAQEAGYPYVDYNGKHEIGTSYAQTTMRNGLRSNAEISFLRPVRHRKNLTIRREAHVTKILIEPATKQAYGVEYVKNKKVYRVFCRKEVIVSAGSLNSPQLLMLSGIGPKDQLEELGKFELVLFDVLQGFVIAFCFFTASFYRSSLQLYLHCFHFFSSIDLLVIFSSLFQTYP
nr:unnamed protein product [Callosobruchus analis]